MKAVVPIPGFKSVEFKRKIQEEIYDKTKNMSDKELTRYYQKSFEESQFAEKPRHTRQRNQRKQNAG